MKRMMITLMAGALVLGATTVFAGGGSPYRTSVSFLIGDVAVTITDSDRGRRHGHEYDHGHDRRINHRPARHHCDCGHDKHHWKHARKHARWEAGQSKDRAKHRAKHRARTHRRWDRDCDDRSMHAAYDRPGRG